MTIIIHCVTFSLTFFGTKLFVHKSANETIVHFHSKSYSIEKHFLIQACQFLNPEILNFISFWSFSIRDFPILLKNHLLSNSQALLLLIVIFFIQFFSHPAFLLCSYFHSICHSKTLHFDLHQVFHYFLGFVHSTQQIVFSDQ